MNKEILQKEKELSEQLFKLRLQDATGKLENPSKIRLVKKDYARLKTVLREVEGLSYEEIADVTGGSFVRVAPGTTGFEELVDQIAAGEGEELDTREITQFEEQYQLFLAFGLVLLLAEALIPDRRKATEEWGGRFA